MLRRDRGGPKQPIHRQPVPRLELEREAQLRAVEQMTATAAEGDLLLRQAETITIAMLRGLFGSLAYTSITITFEK